MINFRQYLNNKVFFDSIKEEHESFLGETPYVVDFASTLDDKQIENRFQRIWKRIKTSKWYEVGYIKKEKVIKHREGLNLYYALLDEKNEPLFVLALDKDLLFNLASYEYRVNDIVKKQSEIYQNEFYKFLVTKENLVLYSGLTQTRKAFLSWKRFALDKTMSLSVVDVFGREILGGFENTKTYFRLSNK